MFAGKRPSQVDMEESKKTPEIETPKVDKQEVEACSTPLQNGEKDTECLLKATDSNEVKEKAAAPKASPDPEVLDSSFDHNTTTENEEAFIVVDNKKKKKRKEKMEARAKVTEASLAVENQDGLKKRRSSATNENESPSSSLRVKVGKACRSLTNLANKGEKDKAKTTTVAEEETKAGSSAPNTTSPLASIAHRDNVEDAVDNGKYAVLVNIE